MTKPEWRCHAPRDVARARGALSHLRRAFVAAAFVAVTGCAGLAPPPALKEGLPESAIFIGNSFFYYNNSLHNHVGRLVRAGSTTPPTFRATSVTISGSGLDWHDVGSYFRPKGIGTYSFAAGNRVVFNEKPERLFDVAIMMDCSQCPVHPQLKSVFAEYARRHADTVRRHGARPVLFMSWAYADKPEMTEPLAQAYTAAGKAVGAAVIPAGLAFARSVAQRPALNLYAPDKRHPSLAGSYLAACTTYAALFGRSPVGSKYTAGLDPATATFLQGVAWETVKAYGAG